MVQLNFVLNPDAAAKVHGLLICLAKFNESVSIEAKKDRLLISALNSSKSAYASFILDGSRFFTQYTCIADHVDVEARFACQIYCKALLSVFKGRLDDPRQKDSSIDRCEVSVIEQSDQTECRLVVKMLCSQGVTKTYRLNYESVDIMHALFDKNAAQNRWSMHSGQLREFVEHFAPRTEQLDIFAENGHVTFTSYTEKVSNGKEILKHPIRTAITANMTDFYEFNAKEKMHIAISVKDFKSVVLHADTLRTVVSAAYSIPTQPLQLSYEMEGMYCEYTLMTTGDSKGIPLPEQSVPTEKAGSAAKSRSAQSTTVDHRIGLDDMPPPSTLRGGTLRRSRPPGTAKHPASPKANGAGSDSLFVPVEDSDDRWEPANYHEGEETLGWNASADNTSFHPTFRDSGAIQGQNVQHEFPEELPPTQRLSQVKGLW